MPSRHKGKHGGQGGGAGVRGLLWGGPAVARAALVWRGACPPQSHLGCWVAPDTHGPRVYKGGATRLPYKAMGTPTSQRKCDASGGNDM